MPEKKNHPATGCDQSATSCDHLATKQAVKVRKKGQDQAEAQYPRQTCTPFGPATMDEARAIALRQPVPCTEEELQAYLAVQVEAERYAAWCEAIPHNSRLDADRQGPAPILEPWANFKQEDKAEAAKPSAKEIFQAIDRNEAGDAELFQRLHGHEYLYDHGLGMWRAFGGVLWEDDRLKEAQRAVVSMADLYELTGIERKRYWDEKAAAKKVELKAAEDACNTAKQDNADVETLDSLKGKKDALEAEYNSLRRKGSEAKKLTGDRARALRGVRRSGDVLKMASLGKYSLGRTGEEFDQHPTLLAVGNGVVDLETGRLLRPDPRLYLTMGSKYPYQGLHCHSAWWDDHLRKVFCGDEEMVDYFENVIGYSITGLQVNKDFWCALGPRANNGKSVTFNTIKEAVGSVATTIKLDVLLEKDRRGSGPDPDLMVLDGMRLGLASEASDKARFSMEAIKAITGGDDIRARAMYADSKIISSKIKLWLHTNKVPSISGFDPGFMLRLRLVPFLATFTDDPAQVDPAQHVYQALNKVQVDRLLAENMTGILSWLVRCARKFLRHMDYHTPAKVRESTDAYFSELDIIGQFLESACEFAPQYEVHGGTLYSIFKQWCVDELKMSEKQIMGHRSFSQDLRNREKMTVKRLRPSIIWGGIRPNADWEGREYGKN